MSFVETFLRKKPEALAPADIADFITRKTEENLLLDYKDIRAYWDFDELSRDVSAFANSEGGLLFLGASQEEGEKIYPENITWGDSSLSKERLEDNLAGKIQPRIAGLKIYPVRREDDSVIFLIDIPQSDNPPHMASDNRYYRRLNFRRIPMEHYEVEDFFGRRRKPKLALMLMVKSTKQGTDTESIEIDIELYLRNVGKAVAKYTQVYIRIPDAKLLRAEHLQDIGHLAGGALALQYNNNVGVLYPGSNQVYIGTALLTTRRSSTPMHGYYELDAEEMSTITGSFVLPVSQEVYASIAMPVELPTTES